MQLGGGEIGECGAAFTGEQMEIFEEDGDGEQSLSEG